MESNYILWLNGVDKLLKRIAPAYVLHSLNSSYDELCRQLEESLQEEAVVKPFRGGIIVSGNHKRIALITKNYSPEKMYQYIKEYRLTNIVFLHHPKTVNDKYIAVGAALNFSFFKQNLPEPVYVANSSELASDEANEALAAFIWRENMPNEYDEVDSEYIVGENSESLTKTSWKVYLREVIVAIGRGILSDSDFYKATIDVLFKLRESDMRK